MPGLRLEPDGGGLRLEESGARLEAVLLSTDPGGAGAADTLRPRLIGAAWQDARGVSRFGWPGGEAGGPDGPTGVEARPAALLPAALALVAAMRRAAPGLGSRALVLGDGLAAILARAVAADFGVREVAAGAAPGVRPALVVVTRAAGPDLEEGLRLAEDGGRVIALDDAGSLPALDFYPEVHRRGLSLDVVPWRPGPADAAALWERGRPRLERMVATLVPPGTSPSALRQDGDVWRLGSAPPGWSIHTPAS